jgi:plastocyanin
MINADLNVVPYSAPLFGEASTRFVIQVFDDDGVSDVQQSQPAKEDTVDIVGLESPFYTPNTIRSLVGETITFDNVDGNHHTVTSVKSGTIEHDGKFDSGLLQPGEEFELVINEKGTHHYYCALHTNMQGTIIVS